MLSATAFQIQALWLHYNQEPMPPNLTYPQAGKQLLDLLGEQKLRQAIALTANDSKLSYEQAGAQLLVLDLWCDCPDLFEEMSAAEVRRLQSDSPEFLYADGEKALITINGRIYRYWLDSLESE
jgi:hypothetical protein